MVKGADTDQLASDLDLHCLQRQGMPGFNRTIIKKKRLLIVIKKKVCFVCVGQANTMNVMLSRSINFTFS